ncbi:MAG: carbohydrate binding domain-containing protein, partial [Muribaculaceae bacterium]|nr:carbohydrate binding domain-containing protein [Muribaculaceae bacterium]
MKQRITAALAVALVSCVGAMARNVNLFSYSVPDGTSGLRLAWRTDSASAWQPIGGDYNFVSSDFGPWGSHKKMFSPKLIKDASTGMWTATWIADPEGQVVAMAVSPDLMKWEPQRYYASELDLPRSMRPAVAVVADSAVINGVKVGGWSQSVTRAEVDELMAYVEQRRRLDGLHRQLAKDDAARFASLRQLRFSAVAQPAGSKKISDKLIGIFFEDINYAADGGLYAEMVQNRDFEYTPADRKGDSKWNATHSWTIEGGSMEIDTVKPLHANNRHFARFDGTSGVAKASNAGWDGMALKRGETYKFSICARTAVKTTMTVELVAADGRIAGRTRVALKPTGSDEWQKYTAQVRCNADVTGASLRLTIPAGAKVDADMVSLFPTHTFHGRDNGLRADLAQMLADLKPRFVRFPGGCVAHGNGIDNIYDWKGSIGPLESRKPLRNIWNYHQTRGLGYHEYFQLCEDLGAEPLPVLSAGVPCQNSGIGAHHSHHALTTLGQQCGIPMEEMDAYVQDVLDLIEYANGGTDTRWGAERARAGHPEPFNMKYIGIGNEDLISEVFVPRFKMIYDAVRERYPDITVVGTVGPFYEGSDYDAGWKLARELSIPMVDEHYY